MAGDAGPHRGSGDAPEKDRAAEAQGRRKRVYVRLPATTQKFWNSIGYDGDFVQVTSGPVGYPLGLDPSGYRMVVVGGEGVEHEYRALEDG